MKINISDNALRVLKRRYLKRNEKGEIVEDPEELFWRVADDIAKANNLYDDERTYEEERKEFFKVMSNFEFIPNSPTLMNAGSEFQQLSACFVLPVGDSLESIFAAIKFTALVHQTGGGTGFSFSKLRPEGDVVRSTGGIASGPISFMKVFDSATDTIKQGGRRRGANMGILRVDHPDITKFIHCKEKEGTLSNFNISVAVTEDFMRKVDSNEEYELINPRTKQIVSKMNAKEVFKDMVDMAWRTGDPGIVFLDRINKDNPFPVKGPQSKHWIDSTNPCVTADTFVHTIEGPRRVADILGAPTQLIINGEPHSTTEEGFFKTGTREVFCLDTEEGYTIKLTKDHLVRRVVSQTRHSTRTEWARAEDLRPGDEVILHNHSSLPHWPGPYNKSEGYLLGLLVGDGTLKKEKAVLSVWTPHRSIPKSAGKSGCVAVMSESLEHTRTLPYRSDFESHTSIQRHNEYGLYFAGIKRMAEDMGIRSGNKLITAELEKCSSAFYIGFLQGLFDADASVQGDHKKGISIRLSQSDINTLMAVQRMLLRLGICSKILKVSKVLKAQHELIITEENIRRFANLVGFTDAAKRNRLENLLKNYKGSLNRERFTATVKGLAYSGIEEVYDVKVPGVNAFDGNGFYIHNCGEQPLEAYESCNLGHINLGKIVKKVKGKPSIDWDKLAYLVDVGVRFLDNVIDRSEFPLQQISTKTKQTRKIGLGVMGFHDLLILLGIPYGSGESYKLAEDLMKFIDDKAREVSQRIAETRGPFPLFEESKYAHNGDKPIRNATRTTIAPTGTTSIIADASQGIEPLFAVAYRRMVKDSLGEDLIEVSPIFKRIAEEHGFYSEALLKKIIEKGSIQDIEEIPEDIKKLFLTASDLTPEQHVRIQAAFQKYCNNAVSKTVNLPNSASREDVSSVFKLAFELGCKGVTVYRDGCKTFQVLSKGTTGKEDVPKKKPRKRLDVIKGTTQKLNTAYGNMYVTINEEEGKPFELFTSIGKSGGFTTSFTEAISRLISLALRSDISPEAVIEQLKGIRSPKIAWDNGDKILSIPDGIAKALERYIKGESKSFQASVESFSKSKKRKPKKSAVQTIVDNGLNPECPDCGSMLEYAEGCVRCPSCGWSEC